MLMQMFCMCADQYGIAVIWIWNVLHRFMCEKLGPQPVGLFEGGGNLSET
jgi:hypothetical protein